jgi:hypothetical protein
VNDILGVGGAEGVGDLADDRQRFEERQSSFEPAHPRSDGFAVEQLHHDVRCTVGEPATVEDLDNARMPDPIRRLGFVEEAGYDGKLAGVFPWNVASDGIFRENGCTEELRRG